MDNKIPKIVSNNKNLKNHFFDLDFCSEIRKFEEEVDNLTEKAIRFNSGKSSPDQNNYLKFLMHPIKETSLFFKILSKDQIVCAKVTKLFMQFLNNGDMLNLEFLLRSPLVKLIDFSNSDLNCFVDIYLEKIIKFKKNPSSFDKLTNKNINKFLKNILLVLALSGYSLNKSDKLKNLFEERIKFESQNTSTDSNKVATELNTFYNKYFN
jgi:hypothetical protein